MAQAAVIIPQKDGFSGFINLGAGAYTTETNVLANIAALGDIDLGPEKIDSLNSSPDDESGVLPMVNFELSYTFAESRTQLYLGNLLEDFLRFDLNSVAGVRQGIGDAGIIGASLRRTSVVTEVWQDPYLTGVKRKRTDRDVSGANIYWQQIFGTGLELEYTSSEVDIDRERSGEALGLSAAERRLLDRNGDINRFDVRYEFSSDDKRHIVTPGIRFIDNDLDGGAMSNDGAGLEMLYIYSPNKRWRHVVNFTYADLEYDKTNPVFGKKDETERLGGSWTSFYVEPFGWKDWSANFTLAWFEEDHDIDFYDTTVKLIGVGMLRRF
ncbi:MAG: DUF2860 family protein [Oceanospirillaceae bacterium]|nr:DUF2860 family protein [Oceanospirillaceae bacterium]